MMKETFVQMIKYGFVGGAAFIVDYGLLILFTEYLGLYYILSSTLAFCVSILVSYFGSIGWVFHNPDTGSKSRDIVAFFIIGIVGLGLTDLILWVFTDLVEMYYLLSKIVATIIVFFWNFFARKIFIDQMTRDKGNG